MYNRYIPQPDGSYRRSRVPEPNRPKAPQRPPAQQPCPPPVPEPCQPPEPPRCPSEQGSPPDRHPPRRREESVPGFLRQLLPKDFDTGDLIIVLLLLLMAGDCEEDRNTALLTLALYFLM